MKLLDNQKQNKFQTFSCGTATVTFDDNRYIVKAKKLHHCYVVYSK